MATERYIKKTFTLEEKHLAIIDGFMAKYGYPGRSAAVRRILELSPETQSQLPQEEPAPCPTPP